MSTKKFKELLQPNNIPYVVMIFSLILRAVYVSAISIYKNQHDAGNLYEGGNLAYFAYLINNGHLPDFDVSTVDQFWQPPLYYVLTAGLLKLSWLVFPSQNGNYEIAQFWPFLFVTLSIYFIWKILQLIFPDDLKLQNLALFFAAFQPSFLVRSATLNCDSMATFIVISMLYVLIRHIYEPHKEDVLQILILFIAGMWTKKSVLICAVVIGIVYLYELIFEKKKDFYKVFVWMILCSPISFGWYIRLKLLWNIPFNFLWAVKNPENVAGYIKNVPVLKRLTDFDIAHFGYRYTYIKNNTEAIDINPFTVLIKTSANDLWFWSYFDDAITKLSYHLVIIRLIIVIAVVIGLAVFLLNKNAPIKNKIAIISFWAFSILSYYIFAFRSPYICSMNFRYIEPILICESVAIGALAGKGKVPFIVMLLLSTSMAAALTLKVFVL